MRIATWNVNSIKQRLDHLIAFLDEVGPDLLCLQELKCVDAAFPAAEIKARGYNLAIQGQKAFNGVAILSRLPLEDVSRGLPGDASDEQARYIEAIVSVDGGAVRIASLYLPNGNPPDTDKYAYKLRWMDRLIDHARDRLALDEAFILAGDFNVIPEPRDAKNPQAWRSDALFLPATRAKFRGLINLGYTEALRACADSNGLYTFWDYQAGAWQRDNGIRIDHLALSPRAADRLAGATIHKAMRGRDKPSDHVPVSIALSQGRSPQFA